ncbi:MAG: NAD+ synthase [Acidobacteria bacterium]|nr:NAD+ synthase [Acidobacteriota bacterium]
MPSVIRIALCQSNLVVGDLSGNVSALQARIREARERGADVALFPELSLTGYPPEDLLLKPSFVQDAAAALGEVAAGATGIVACVGVPEPVAAASGAAGGGEAVPATARLHNAAAVLADGRVAALYRKHRLPNYAVFDERRYFLPGSESLVIDLDGRRVGVTICEDIWMPGGPAEWAAVNGGAEIVVNLSASPYHRGKGREREALFAARCRDHRCFLAFCNAVGGQDELVFDGHSLVIGPEGTILARGRPFEEDLLVADLDPSVARDLRKSDPRWDRSTPSAATVRGHAPEPDAGRVSVVRLHQAPSRRPPPVARETAGALSPEAEIYRALTLGTADYIRKNGFPGAVLGLSGGIDSALALTIAADAIGPDAVTAVSMPSRYTAGMNRDDAAILARRLGTRFLELPIEDLAISYGDALAEPFAGTEPNVAEENLQARIRGNLLMALSNKFGWLVLTTGNKSEMSVGYATLYGDMAGGFAVLKDVLKTWVYRLAVWRNRDGEVIPRRIIDKPPTAELRDNQRDSDSLPPYDVLDGILEAYVEQDRSPAEIGALGFARETVDRVVQLVDRAEYKRRQAPPGVRISTRAFGKDRRLPVTNRYAPAS